MKKTLIWMLSLLVLGLTGCDEDFNKDVAPPQANEQEEAKDLNFQVALAPGFSSPVNLNDVEADAVIQAITVSSSPALDEGTRLSFALQISKTEDFAAYMDMPLTVTLNDNTAAVTAADLDGVIKQMFGKAPNANPIYVRTYVYVRNRTSTVRSTANIVGPATVTPVALPVNPYLYVPGNHQGWTPATAPILYSANMDLIYEGFVYLDGEYKFTSAPDWDHTNYGNGGEGVLSTDGGAGNLTAPAGFYFLKADLNLLTYQQTKTDWGLIGDATAGGWDSSTPMTYNVASNTWTVTTNLTAGAFKFRANDGWDINLGGDVNNLTFGGADINNTEAGNYTITLTLTNADGGYRATLKKN